MLVNRQKWFGIGGISLTMLLLLSQFQNCAPSGLDGLAASDSSSLDPGMRVVDDWSAVKVNIFNNVVQTAAAETSVNVEGFCDRHIQQNEPMRWQVSAPSEELVGQAVEHGEAIMAGAVGCERGGFRLQISELNQLRCDTAYNLEVSTLNGETDQAVLIRNCAL